MTVDNAFSRFPELTTARLHLRRVQATDAKALFAIKSDFEVTKHYGQEPHQSLEQTMKWMQRLDDYYERREGLYWCLTLKDQDSVIGGCTLWNFDPDFQCVELGYELYPAYLKQGIMSETVTAVVNYGFTELDLNRIEANLSEKNAASKNLLLRLGFTHEGRLRQRIFFQGQFEDELYFGLLKAEWIAFTNQ